MTGVESQNFVISSEFQSMGLRSKGYVRECIGIFL